MSEKFKPTASYESMGDRFSSKWTFFLLLTLASIVAFRQYHGPNVVCNTPVEFKLAKALYVQEHCWMGREIVDPSNVMFRRDDLEFDMTYIQRTTPDEGEENTRSLYQWLPLLFVCQALIFRLPDVFLGVVESTFGFEYRKMIRKSTMFASHTAIERKVIAKDLGLYFISVFKNNILHCKPFGIITVSIGLVKLLYFVNAVTQLTLLEGYLSPRNVTSFGEYVVNSIVNENYTYVGYSPAFPRDILCEVNFLMMTKVDRWSIQCIAPINEFNEKVCFFLWIWLLVVCLASGTSLLVYLITTFLPMMRQRYIRKFLSMSNMKFDNNEVNDFSSKTIGQDGVYVLRMVGEMSSDILVRDILTFIWSESNCLNQPFSDEPDQRPEEMNMVQMYPTLGP